MAAKSTTAGGGAGLGKLFRGGFKDKIAHRWKAELGIEVKGNETFTAAEDPSRPGPRKLCLPIAEGLAAVVSGHVTDSYVDPAGAIYVSIAPGAYEGSVTTEACTVDANVVGYLDRGKSLVGSSIESTSTEGQSKTEISIAACALIEALVDFTTAGDEKAKALLEAHYALLARLRTASALPMDRCGVTLEARAAEEVRNLVMQVTDRIYSWLVYRGERPSAGTSTTWGFAAVVSWPIAGAEAAMAASFASGNLHETIARADELGWALGVPGVAPAPGAPASTPAPEETWLQRAVRYAAAVNVPILLAGPASGGKTRLVLGVADRMPTWRTSMTAEADVAFAIGDLAPSADGKWQPRLGRLSRVIRYAMLAALIVSFRRGRSLSHPDPDPFSRSDVGREVWWALEALSADPDDMGSRAVLEERAWPFHPESWEPVLYAWEATASFLVGPVVRLFLDELHDAASANSGFGTVLKLALEDERQFLTETAGAGWLPMFCDNVHFCGAGNPDEKGEFGRALRSRFGFTVAVGLPDRDQMIGWNRAEFAAAERAGAPRRRTAAKPLSILDAIYEPPAVTLLPLGEREISAAVDYCLWTREQYAGGMLKEPLDSRGVRQTLSLVQHLRSAEGLSSREALETAARLVVDRLCESDDLGLPNRDQRDAALDKLKQIARGL